MATQAIRFTGPPSQTITLDVVDISDDSLQQSGLTCTESTNDKGTYTTANFTDTLTGRHAIIKKISGTAFGKDYATMVNANGTYQSDEHKLLVAGVDSSVTAATESELARKWQNNKRTITVLGANQWRYELYDDDETTVIDTVDFDPATGNKTPV